MNYNKSIDKLRNNLSEFIRHYKLESLVGGISGGIDSALVFALAYPVARELGIELIGRSISIEQKTDEEKRANIVGSCFTTNFDKIDLTKEYLFFKNNILTHPIIKTPESKLDAKYRISESKARLRMIYLYDLAMKNKGIVLSTDNYTELMLGFFALHGDVGDYGIIQNIWKTEVYGMAEWLANNEYSGESSDILKQLLMVSATDGLGVLKTDLDYIMPDWNERHNTTREGYSEVDDILIRYFKNNDLSNFNKSEQFVINGHETTKLKRISPYNVSRNEVI